jgi:hypothetical protein
MREYKVRFLLNGEMKDEIVNAQNSREAMEIIESKYVNAVAHNASIIW